MWSERLERKREVRVPAGSVWWRQTADRLGCISWISQNSPGLSSSPHVCFAAGCWGSTIVKLHHLLQLCTSKIILTFCNASFFFFSVLCWNEHFIFRKLISNTDKMNVGCYFAAANILKSVFTFNLSIYFSLLEVHSFHFLFCLSVPPGWWLPGDLHQPSGDCKDPSAGGRRDHHGAEGQRPVRHQGPGLLWTLQGEKRRSGQMCMCGSLHTMQLGTKGSGVADVVQMHFCGGVRWLVDLMSEPQIVHFFTPLQYFNTCGLFWCDLLTSFQIQSFSLWMWYITATVSFSPTLYNFSTWNTNTFQ